MRGSDANKDRFNWTDNDDSRTVDDVFWLDPMQGAKNFFTSLGGGGYVVAIAEPTASNDAEPSLSFMKQLVSDGFIDRHVVVFSVSFAAFDASKQILVWSSFTFDISRLGFIRKIERITSIKVPPLFNKVVTTEGLLTLVVLLFFVYNIKVMVADIYQDIHEASQPKPHPEDATRMVDGRWWMGVVVWGR